MKIFITGMGIISAVGRGINETEDALRLNKCAINRLSIFEISSADPLPVGEIRETLPDALPRTHSLALIAAREAVTDTQNTPDAVVIGVTTGGMPASEKFIKEKKPGPELYTYHNAASVATAVAQEVRCTGPVITISNACSSGTAALKAAVELLRTGTAKRVLVGGADALCRLTYFGFNSLQLLDPDGARPLDKERKGMSVAEGAAMLLLESENEDNAIAEICGVGLSCDAYHPAAPHPEGEGARRAMKRALSEAGLAPGVIDYINLHGTGTLDNDLSEARAVTALFGKRLPLHSSVKGAFGHSLGASGAIEAVISALTISKGLVPANTGCKNVDPDLRLDPVMQPVYKDVSTVLSNSFGFGGNNASLVMSRPGISGKAYTERRLLQFTVLGSACLTGAGDTEKTIEAILSGTSCRGVLPTAEVSEGLDPKSIRRLKRQPRLVLSTASAARKNSGMAEAPTSIFLGTAWGSLSETMDFLDKLFSTDEKFTSPTDFMGSVHNAPAGQAAIKFKAKGANITTSGEDYSFEQALFTACLLAEDEESVMLIGSDEYHERMSPVFDPSCAMDDIPSDGCGALFLKPAQKEQGPKITALFFKSAIDNNDVITSLIAQLGGEEKISQKYGALFAGIPMALRERGGKQLHEFCSAAGFIGPVIDYRKILGEYPSSSAVAAVIALHFIKQGEVPSTLCSDAPCALNNRGILMLGFGDYITASGIFQ